MLPTAISTTNARKVSPFNHLRDPAIQLLFQKLVIQDLVVLRYA